MKNITLSAEENLIELARETARAHNKTLNQLFREWLESYTRPNSTVEQHEALLKRLAYVGDGRRFTRAEMNER